MPSSTSVQQSAQIVELAAFRSPRRRSDLASRSTAELLSLRRSLTYEASVEIDDLDALSERLEPARLTNSKLRVRRWLDREFGRLRVHRCRQRFVVRHRSVEALIAGLLRVQFHVQQIRLPETDRNGQCIDQAMLSLTWGVGQSGLEAELERLRRSRHKLRR